MVLHQTNVSGLTSIQLGDFFSPLPECIQARQYTVILHKSGTPIGDLKAGYVVSHLSIWDWCELYGYWLIKLYPDLTRNARPNERTDLF